MCSEKRLIANQLNALKSTGPRTGGGKLVVAQNAIKHGLRGAGAAAVVLEEEDPQPFEELRAELQRDLAPRGAMQRLLFERILACAWRLRRAHLIEQGFFIRGTGVNDDRLSYPSLLEQHFTYACESADALGKLARYENAIDRGMARALAELRRLQAAEDGATDLDSGQIVEPAEKLAEQTQISPQIEQPT
jgi:hypothetical protein